MEQEPEDSDRGESTTDYNELRRLVEDDVEKLLDMAVSKSDDTPESRNMQEAIKRVLADKMVESDLFRNEVERYLESKII